MAGRGKGTSKEERSGAGRQSAALNSPASGTPDGDFKQAVVVIHGMGEQVPMATLRSFVHAVWETDLSLTADLRSRASASGHPLQGEANKVWIVPDTRTGSMELDRIATDKSDFGVRTDFYEFYWADIMQGTSFDHVKAWVSGLLLRWPHQVPRGMTIAWILLWIFVLAFLYLTSAGLLGLTDFYFAGGNAGQTELGGAPIDDDTIGRSICAVAGIGSFIYLVVNLAKSKEQSLLSWLVAIAVPPVVAWAAAKYIPWGHVLSRSALLLGASALLGYFIHQFLVPYFGDVARYVRAAPDTVAKRAEVRSRGLSLLRELHGMSRTANARADETDPAPNDASRYLRVIVVAHSLGAVIAYDLLKQFWAEAGPGRKNPPEGEVRAALQAVDDYLKINPVGNRSFDLQKFRVLQRRASLAINTTLPCWRITDFVTLGSPLTHADFLIARDRNRFESLVEERLAPVSPPLLDAQTGSMSFSENPEAAFTLHHAAMFATTRWTNIYDPHRIVLGDIVSGPATRLFRGGISDLGVRLRSPTRWRIFTHTLYWAMDAWGTALCSAAPGSKSDGSLKDKDHIALLRSAIDLRDVEQEANILLSRKSLAMATHQGGKVRSDRSGAPVK